MKKLLTLAAISIIIGCGVQKAIPTTENGIYSIQVNNTVLEIDANAGGRISALKLDGKNFFTGSEVHADYWGSTLWPSPQKEWGGTPPPELDNQPYSVEIYNKRIKMLSRKDSKFGYIFSKEVSGDTKNSSFIIKYTITNHSDQVRNVAPWEVTRVHTKDFAFYPKGTGERWGNIANLAEDKDGITWFTYQEDKIPVKHNKFFADGSEGWISQVNEDVIFIKKFPNISAEKAAPAESEIEVYTNPGKSYVEIEQQGAYQKLKPGDSLTWEVNWFLRKIPATIKREAGSPALVTYVRKMVN